MYCKLSQVHNYFNSMQQHFSVTNYLQQLVSQRDRGDVCVAFCHLLFRPDCQNNAIAGAEDMKDL